MKYLKKNEVVYNKPTKNENSFYILRRDRETFSSPIDQAPVINSSNNSVSTSEDLLDNISIISNSIDILDKFIDTTLFNLTQKSKTEKKIWQTAANTKY